MKSSKLLAACLIIFLLGMPVAKAKDLNALELKQLCSSEAKAEQLNCQAYLRAIGERLQVTETYFAQPCRKSPVSKNDFFKFREFLKNEPVSLDTSANAYAIKYWSQAANGVPCLESGELWSAKKLADLCRKDMSGSSLCKFYTLSLLEFINTQYALQKKSFMCLPKNSTHLSDKTALAIFDSWLSANNQSQNRSAAEQFPSALQAKYPCENER